MIWLASSPDSAGHHSKGMPHRSLRINRQRNICDLVRAHESIHHRAGPGRLERRERALTGQTLALSWRNPGVKDIAWFSGNVITD